MEMTPRPDLIFDLGMHVAQDTEFYLRKGFRVVAIEANPVLARAARSRLHGAVEEGRLVVLAVGIGGTRGLSTFFIDPVHSEWSSFEPGLGGRSGEGRKVAVPTVVLGDVLREFGCPHYLKIDIEGHDLLALRQLEESGCRPSFVSVENGQPPMLETLVRMGYAGFKFINQATVPKLRLPLRAREGRRIGHRFPSAPPGHSGRRRRGRGVPPRTSSAKSGRTGSGRAVTPPSTGGTTCTLGTVACPCRTTVSSISANGFANSEGAGIVRPRTLGERCPSGRHATWQRRPRPKRNEAWSSRAAGCGRSSAEVGQPRSCCTIPPGTPAGCRSTRSCPPVSRRSRSTCRGTGSPSVPSGRANRGTSR
ncbi:MAG: FkbM family methyltransferase [Thermoflexaceae bacterium]|nr:FkbM family methyltransferase [Thermoflexaceae bacterium]